MILFRVCANSDEREEWSDDVKSQAACAASATCVQLYSNRLNELVAYQTSIRKEGDVLMYPRTNDARTVYILRVEFR